MSSPVQTTTATPPLRSLLALGLILLAGCSTLETAEREPDRLAPGGDVITREEVERLGAHDALEVVRRSMTHLRIQHTRNGTPVRITHRGISSFLLSPEILVVIDGSRVSTSARHLESIPASSIDFIQILSAREATAKWGAEGGNGVIVVSTSAH